MGSTRAHEGLHDQTTSHMSSLRLATQGRSSDFAAEEVQEEGESNTPEQEAD
jgi:hypothetical protein